VKNVKADRILTLDKSISLMLVGHRVPTQITETWGSKFAFAYASSRNGL